MYFTAEQVSRCTAALPLGRLKRLGDIKNIFYSNYSYHSCSPRFALFCPQIIQISLNQWTLVPCAGCYSRNDIMYIFRQVK